MNIVVILVDTLRADHLGCYGYSKPTSPAIDALAAGSVVYEQCLAPGIPTTPAHATIYTGLHPLEHNIVCHGGSADLARALPVLPELLQQAGYTTCAVDNLYDLKPWLSRGYEFYINPSHRHRMRLLMTCEEVNHRAVEWIRGHAAEPFFLFVHYWEPHTPYLPPGRHRTFYSGSDPFDPAHTSLAGIRRTPFWGMWGDTWFKKLGPITDADYVTALYDGEIRHADEGVGALLHALEAAGVADDTAVVLTADHGEVMARNGIYFDHHGLYEDNIHVPLIARIPGRAAARVPEIVTHMDIAPTLLGLAGAPIPAGLPGVDLCAPDAGLGVPQRAGVVCCEATWQAKWCLRTETRKLILSREPDRYGTPRRELYDLADDPGETRNLADARPAEADAMELKLEAWIASELLRTGRETDPLVAQGITLGRRWDDWLARNPALRDEANSRTGFQPEGIT